MLILIGLFILGCLLGGLYERVLTGHTGGSILLEKLGISPSAIGIPFLPIYGFGLILVYLISKLQIPFIVQIIIVVITLDLLECIGGYMATYINKSPRWKYNGWTICSGYVSLMSTIMWSIFGALLLGIFKIF